jgi:mono/diheme cytochrome c family protein
LKLHHALLLPLFVAGVAACRQDMHDQPKHKPFTASNLFKDRRSARPLVAGTVARGQLMDDTHLWTGKVGDKPAESFPGALADTFGPGDWQRNMLVRGRERFSIHCTPCHGSLGDGNGMIVQRGMKRPPSFHIERLQKSPPGYYFDVITNGFGAMFDQKDRISVPDRWAIAAYVQALQQSQNALYAQLDERQRREVESAKPFTAGRTPGASAHRSTAPNGGGGH